MSEELTIALIVSIGPIGAVIGSLATIWLKGRKEWREGGEKAYEKAIEILKGRFDRANDPAELAAIEQQLREAEDEYLPYLRKKAASIARRVRSELAPTGAITPDMPGLSEPELDELQRAVATIQDFDPPEAAEDHFFQGNAFYAAGQVDKALDQYNRALQLRPDDLDTLNNRGTTLDSLQRYDEALADYNRALELTPDHPHILNNRGLTLSKLQRYDEALTDYSHALQIQPRDAEIIYNQACTLSLMERLTDAFSRLQEAISIDSKCRLQAREDEDFDNLRSDPTLGPEFERLVAEPDA